jgi:hypothetical protein
MFVDTRRRLAEALKKRDVRQIVYFHCDHFEPWRGFKGDVSERNVADILEFLRVLEGVDYARKLTLFYKCHNTIRASTGPQQMRAQGDEIGFSIPSARTINIARGAMEHIAHRTGHEIQVHYHHEFFTSNDKYCMSIPETRDFFQKRNTPELDRARWDVGLALALETIRLEANIPLKNWFFVHGMWALNASDREVCTITDEIARLQKFGCLGDFSFPAGRPHCDPNYEEPIFVRPVTGPRAYDLPEAEAEAAYGNAAAARDGKFFIWSSAIKANGSSIDYYAQQVRQRCEDVAGWGEEMVEKSLLKDGTLFIKTHAHSMYIDYYDGARRSIPPHLYPGVQNLFGALFDGASDAGVDVEFATASEIYERFGKATIAPREEKKDPAAAKTSARAATVPATAAPTVPAAAAPTLAPAARPASATIAEMGSRINQVALTVMRERVASLGSAASGAYAYYESLIKQGKLLQKYEIEVASYLNRELPADQPVVEVRCGLGMLVLLLAASGRVAYGIEADRHRLASFSALRDAIGSEVPRAKANSSLLAGFFPRNLPELPPRNSVLVFNNTVCGLSPDEQRAVVAASVDYAGVLFDAQRFFTKRTTPAEIDPLFGIFTEAGFTPPVKAIDLGQMGAYYRTSPRKLEQ